jgi:hypothetical protein
MTSSFPLSFYFPLCLTGQGSAYISWQGINLHDFSLFKLHFNSLTLI